MKTCFKCQRVKPLAQFYRHPMMADGHLGKCKACTKKDVAEHRAKNIERIREYDRQRAHEPHRAALRLRVGEEWSAKHPGRTSAQQKLRRAVRAGRVLKPTTCQWCDRAARIEGHHDDYAKPLDVLWLCKPCHAIADRDRRAKEAA